VCDSRALEVLRLLWQVVSRAQTTAAASTTTSQNLADVKSNKTLRPQMDFGMSKPEDKDMYTTRG